MSDLVQKLVVALERLSGQCERMRLPGQRMSDAEKNAIAALSAAKDRGWVAVPQVPTPEMVKTGLTALFDRKLPPAPWEDCIAETYAAMLAARPLPNPPKGEV